MPLTRGEIRILFKFDNYLIKPTLVESEIKTMLDTDGAGD